MTLLWSPHGFYHSVDNEILKLKWLVNMKGFVRVAYVLIWLQLLLENLEHFCHSYFPWNVGVSNDEKLPSNTQTPQTTHHIHRPFDFNWRLQIFCYFSPPQRKKSDFMIFLLFLPKEKEIILISRIFLLFLPQRKNKSLYHTFFRLFLPKENR